MVGQRGCKLLITLRSVVIWRSSTHVVARSRRSMEGDRAAPGDPWLLPLALNAGDWPVGRPLVLVARWQRT